MLDYPSIPPAAARSSSRWIALVALLVSLLAAGGAGWAVFKPAPKADAKSSMFSAAAVDNPKSAACNAATLVANGVMRQSQINLGPEPAALETVAANTRLAMAGGAVYLRDTVPSNTPPELAESIAALARELQDIAQHYFVGQTSNDPAQAGRLAAADETTRQIADLCK